MKGSHLLIATLTLALTAFGQSVGGASSGGTSSGSATTAGSAPGVQGTTATSTATTGLTNGVSTSGGYVYSSAPASPPLLVTPIVHLGSVTPGAGATASAGGNPVGASSFSNSLSSPPVTIVPEISYPGEAMNSATTAEGRVIAIGPPVADLGPGAGANSAYAGQHALPQGESLAEYAAKFRSRNQNQSAHVYTNADVDRINQQTGGVTGTAVNAGNNPGTATPAGNSSMPAVGQPAGQTPTMPGITAPAQRQNPQPPSPFTPHPQAQLDANPTQQPSEMAQATPPAPTGSTAAAAENSETSQSSGEKQRSLPRSASPLPLMAVMGFLAATAGMFLRRS